MPVRNRTKSVTHTPPIIQRKITAAAPESSDLPPPSISAQLQAARRGHSLSSISVGGSQPLQTKLRVNQPGDAFEQEAEQAAEQVMRMSDADALSEDVVESHSARPSLQRTGASAGGMEAPSSVHATLQSPGQPLDSATRAFMEPRFGHDFSDVRIHTDQQATESARSVNALAYTVGQHIAFDAGQYAPSTGAGQQLLAHELAHTVQQRDSGDVVQRLIRTPYPWRGILLQDAELRSAADTSSPSTGTLVAGETVSVLSASGDWLAVESTANLQTRQGYVEHTNVDDATAHAMDASIGTTMVWKPSGPGSGTDFEQWASAARETPFPDVSATTVMNCWEAVLLAAYRAGAIDWNWINNLYVSVDPNDWVAHMSRGASQHYAIPGPNQAMPQRGDLVFFNGLAHVAMATGSGSDVFTFWPPPNTPFTLGGTTDQVKVFTIEELVDWWEQNLPPAPVVTFAAPSW